MTSQALRTVDIALQGGPGVAEAPDVALRALCGLAPKVEKVVVAENIGTFAPQRHYIGALSAEGTLTLDAVYEQLPFPVSMAMGFQTPAGGAPPYTWTFPLPDAIPETFALFTVEYTDGGAPNGWVVQAIDVFGTGLTISGEAGKSWKVECPIVGGETTQPLVLTGAPVPGAATPILMAHTTLSIDDLYANLGITPLDASLKKFSWKLEGLQHQKQFAGALWPTGRGNNVWKVTLELLLEVDAIVLTGERGKFLTTDWSAIRIEAVSGANKATLDGNYMLQEIATLDEQDGNNLVTLTYAGEKDDLDNTGAVVIVNTLDAL